MNGKILIAFGIIALFLASGCINLEGEKKNESKICADVITKAKNPTTGEIKEFPTPCDVPEGWEIVKNEEKMCLEVITKAKNVATGEIKEFPNSCIPEGWMVISSDEEESFGNQLKVSNQKPSNEITIGINSVKPGFIVVYKLISGKQDSIIGLKYIERTEEFTEMKIKLDHPTLSLFSYNVVLYEDNGDKVFDSEKDKIARMADDRLVVQTFTADPSS